MCKLLVFRLPLILFGSLMLITGCAATGGTLGGLIPLPKVTKGEIKNNRYYAKDGSFSVALPHENPSHEYTYMALKEKYTNEETYVSFGPAAFDRTIYRIDLVEKSTPYSQSFNLESMKDVLFEQYANVINATYRCQLRLVSKGTCDLNQYKAYVCEFCQYQPSTMTLNGMTEPENIQHMVYIVENKDYLAIISYAAPEGGMNFPTSREKFIQSFTLSEK